MKITIAEVLRNIDPSLLERGNLDEAIEKTQCYFEELKKWNQHINLTADHGEISFFQGHIIDSLQYTKAIAKAGEALDIGSGAGFPGLPLSIFLTDLQITLLESRRKRANFLRATIRRLGLEQIQVIHDRAENLKENAAYRDRFQYVLFRAVTGLFPSLELAAPLVKVGGRVIAKKAMTEKESGIQGLSLVQEIPIRSATGAESKLMVFEKCFT